VNHLTTGSRIRTRLAAPDFLSTGSKKTGLYCNSAPFVFKQAKGKRTVVVIGFIENLGTLMADHIEMFIL
jgi:hypothetical protein